MQGNFKQLLKASKNHKMIDTRMKNVVLGVIEEQ